MTLGEYTLSKSNGTTFDEKVVLAQYGKVLGFDVSLNPAMLSISDINLLNDTWLTSYDYAGNLANVLKISKDNLIEFAQPVGIDALYHVINSGFNDIVNIPVDITSPDNTQHGVGITIGGQRLFSVSALATATTALVDTYLINTAATISSSVINPLLTLAESWIGPSSTTGIYFKSGNVGIGNVAPRNGGTGATLDVLNNLYLGQTGIQNPSINSDDSLFFNIDANNDNTMHSFIIAHNGTGTAGTELFRVQENGNVGIGTTGPLSKLHIEGSTNLGSQIRLKNTAGSAEFLITPQYNVDALEIGDENGNSLVHIRGGGNVGIGYSTGTEITNNKLAVNGSGYFNTTLTVNGLTASKLVFTDASKNLTSTGIGTSSQFIKGDGSLDSTVYITSAGTATNVSGTVAIAHGGTGAITEALARTALGLTIGTDVLAYRTFGTAANSATTDFQSPITSVGALYGTGSSVAAIALAAGQVMRRNLANTAYEAYVPIPGGSIPSGTITGQMMWWNNTSGAWNMTNTSYLKYDDSTGTVILGVDTIDATSFESYLMWGSAGSRLYGISLTRGAHTRSNYPTTNILLRPDVVGLVSTSGHRLSLGRSAYITDLVLGDNTGTDTDGGTGIGSAYVRWPAFSSTAGGVLKVNSTGEMSVLAYAVAGTRFLREDGTWQVANSGMTYPGAGIAVSNGTAWITSITDESANWNSAYSWGNHSSAGYGLASALTTHAGLTTTAHGLGGSAFHTDGYYQIAGSYEAPLTFSTGLSRSINSVTCTITQYTDALARAAVSSSATGLTYTSATGVFSLTSGYAIPSTTNIATWNGLTTFPGFGTSGITACVGNDARLSDTRTPTSHTHGNITNAGAIGLTASLPIITTTSGVLTVGSFGTTTGTFAAGDHTHSGYGTVTSITAGYGMVTGTITTSGTITLGTPDTITASSSNIVNANSHNHAITGFLALTGGTLTGAVTSNNSFTGTNYLLSSDIRKKNPLGSYVPTYLDIDYQTYEYKGQEGQIRFGLYSYQLKNIAPELITVDKYGFDQVSYIDLFIREIAYLKSEINRLKSEIRSN